MTRLLRLLCARSLVLGAVLAVALAGCGSFGSVKVPPVPITGVITDQYTQKPLAGATVSLGGAAATTDEQGRFNIAAGDPPRTLVISASGYASSTLALADADLSVQTALRPNTLRGTLLDRYTNAPIAGAQVVATGGLSATTAISATTGADGSYLLAGVPESFELAVSAPDYAPEQAQINRSTDFAATLRPTVLRGTLLDKYSSQPIVGAVLTSGAATATTDSTGAYVLRGIEPDQELVIVSGDYTTQTLTTPASTTLSLQLRPSTIRGLVTDASTGKPLRKGTVIAMPAPEGYSVAPTLAYTGTAVAMTRLNPDGTYTLKNVPEGAQIQVLSPGYRKAWTSFAEGEFEATLAVEPFVAKAIYITAATASSRSALSELFDLVDNTELNAVVIDIKLDFYNNVGGVGYISKHPMVIEAGTAEDYLDMPWIVEEARRRNIYLIGRMAVMRDNRLADARPEWAAHDRNGGVWEDHGGLKWLDPFNPNVREYNIGIAKEIADYGFDEIQFDYIRFPSDGSTSNLVFSQPIDPENNPEKMYAAIVDVLEEAHVVINGSGAFFSIDVFGYATWRNMWEIGQSLELMADHTDYVCAMVYPSHYDRYELGLDNADAHPYEIVKDSIEKGQKRMEGKYAVQRPWLQGFTATWLSPTINYGRAELRAQMRAVEEVPDTYGWTIWNAANAYDDGWFDQE